MIDPDTTEFRCDEAELFALIRSYNDIVTELPVSIRRRFFGVFDHLREKCREDYRKMLEQLNGKTVSQIVAEFEAEVDPWQMIDFRTVWRPILEQALNGNAAEVMLLGCPQCSGSLSIRFDPDSPQAAGGTAGCLQVFCRDETLGTIWDALEKTPEWCDSLGTEIQTQPEDD